MRHTQILVRAEVRNPLLTIERADAFMRLAVEAAGMNIISGPHSVLGVIPGNEGVTSVVALDYSSADLHEWPDKAPFPLVYFALWTCGQPPSVAQFRNLFDQLDPVRFSASVIDIDELLLGGAGWPTRFLLSAA